MPPHLLDGGEIILLAVKPSLWFIPFVSWRWLLAGAALMVMGVLPGWLSTYRALLVQAGVVIALVRLAWATMQWVSRLYVLTNRRVMRISGLYNVEVFECPLTRIQNTRLVLPWNERMVRTGTIEMATAGFGSGSTSWRVVARPLEVHEQLRAAISRSSHHGGNGV